MFKKYQNHFHAILTGCKYIKLRQVKNNWKKKITRKTCVSNFSKLVRKIRHSLHAPNSLPSV